MINKAAPGRSTALRQGDHISSRPHPMTGQLLVGGAAVKGERSESAGHERSECS
jgi:hypothetical protein